jgi:hypothetical protein
VDAAAGTYCCRDRPGVPPRLVQTSTLLAPSEASVKGGAASGISFCVYRNDTCSMQHVSASVAARCHAACPSQHLRLHAAMQHACARPPMGWRAKHRLSSPASYP